MSRRIWTVAAAAWAGTVSAQMPQAPESLGGHQTVISLRTAGQPERKVQVLKTERLPDGKILTEVKDLATGSIFTIADTQPLASGPNPLPVVAPVSSSTTLPGTTVNANLPQAKPRNYDPLLGTMPSAQVGNSAPVRSTTPTQTEFPTLVGKLRQNSTPTVAPTPTLGSKPQSAISAALFGSNGQPQEFPTLVGRFQEPASPARSTAGVQPGGMKTVMFGSPQTPRQETPTLMDKLFGDKPVAATTKSVSTPNPRYQTNVIRPNAVPGSTSRMAISSPPRIQEPEQPTIVPVQQVEPVTALAPVSTDSADPNFHVVPPKPMTMKQIEEMVKDLRMHHKPSQRVEAANALANCPMSGMVEVRQILAEASFRDPIPVVRAHCIDLLTKMGYDEPNYRTYVEGLINDEEPAVQRAARAAVK